MGIHVLILVILALIPSSNGGLLHSKTNHRFRRPLSSSSSAPLPPLSSTGPNVFFEVSKPAGAPSSPCSALILEHAFANTYSLPPAIANYTPPIHCGTAWDQVVLKWSGTCKGRQYDRIAAVWFGGVEVLRTCTAEPTSNGIYWEVRKDVTRFSSVFRSPQIVALELANVVDSTYTGIFNINLTLEFYGSRHREPHERFHGLSHQDGSGKSQTLYTGDGGIHTIMHHDTASHTDPLSADSACNVITTNGPTDGDPSHLWRRDVQTLDNHGARGDGIVHHDAALPADAPPMDSSSGALPVGFSANAPADVIIPISKPDALSRGYWFTLTAANETASRTFNPPKNIYRAVLEICVSFHDNDEFWYTNPPNEYLEENGLSGYPGNGPFREVQVFLDDMMVGAVWPFPVIFTGGINPLLWRPAAAIGAYNLPSYDVEITPFVGLLVDGNNHTISMRVENSDGSWPLDANLHLWLDPHTSQTMGGLLSYDASAVVLDTSSDFEGLDGTFHTSAERTISFSGYIISSVGNFLASVSYAFTFDNILVFQNSSAVETVTQETRTKGEVIVTTPSQVVFSQVTTSVYPFYLSSLDSSGANSVYTEECNLTHSFNRETSIISPTTSVFESLKNSQAAEGSMTVVGSSVTAGVGALQQHYDYDSSQGCYDRLLSTKNYSILYDITDLSCECFKAQY
eukprot:c21083_g1_i1 orf=129-2183(+)